MPINSYDLVIDKDYPPGALITPTGGTVHTRHNTTTSILYFGLGGARVTGGNYRDIKLPDASTDVLDGVFKLTDSYEVRDGYSREAATGYVGYPVDREVSIIRPGEFAQIAVWVDSATAVNDPVFWRHTATPGTTGLAGCFRSNVDTASAIAIVGARFIKTVSAPIAGQMAISWIEFT